MNWSMAQTVEPYALSGRRYSIDALALNEGLAANWTNIAPD
jgi:hypothetical protein